MSKGGTGKPLIDVNIFLKNACFRLDFSTPDVVEMFGVDSW